MTPEEEEKTHESLKEALSIFSWPHFPTKVANSTMNQTFVRINPRTKSKEMIGYAGKNQSMNYAQQHVWVTKRHDSLLNDDCVYVKAVCWMDPWARIEHIPAQVTRVAIYLYHAYMHNFLMAGDIEIRLAPQHVMTQAIWDPSFKLVKSLPWPFKAHENPKDQMVKQLVCYLDIDRS